MSKNKDNHYFPTKKDHATEEAWERAAERSFPSARSHAVPPSGGTPSTSGGSTNGSTFHFKSCTHTPKAVRVGDTRIYAAGSPHLSVTALAHFDIVSPLLEHNSSMYEKYTGMLLWFPIRDMTAPDPQRLRVHCERLIAFARQGCKVLTFCMGSHGRTGTVLATCIALLEPEEDPIDTVRERHCKSAVETSEQIAAVFAAVGRPMPARWANKAQRKDFYTGPFIKPAMSPLLDKGFQAALPPDQRGQGGHAVPSALKAPEGAATHVSTCGHTEPAEGGEEDLEDLMAAIRKRAQSAEGASCAKCGRQLPLSDVGFYCECASCDPRGQSRCNHKTPTVGAAPEPTAVAAELEAPPPPPTALTPSEFKQVVDAQAGPSTADVMGDVEDIEDIEIVDVPAPAAPPADASATTAPQEEATAGTAAPFPKAWSRGVRKKFHGAANPRTSDGYLRCPICDNLILETKTAQLVKSRVGYRKEGSIIRRPRVRWVKHTACSGAPDPEKLGCKKSPEACI